MVIGREMLLANLVELDGDLNIELSVSSSASEYPFHTGHPPPALRAY